MGEILIIFEKLDENDVEVHVLQNILLNKLEHGELDATLITNITHEIHSYGYQSGKIVGDYYAKDENKKYLERVCREDIVLFQSLSEIEDIIKKSKEKLRNIERKGSA